MMKIMKEVIVNIKISVLRTPLLSFILYILLMFSNDVFGQNIFTDTIVQNKKTKVMHIGWEDGRVPEFSNAYTLRCNEIKLNILGRSSIALSDKLEMSTYLPLIVTPNVAFKYRFLDSRFFALAIEVGTAVGIFPIAFASGFLLPGVAVGAGSIGLLHGYDSHLKLFLSFKPTKKLTFSFRGSASAIYAAYLGGGAFLGVGGNGAAAGLFPISESKKFKFYSGGFETDYVVNKRNAIVLDARIGGFCGGKKQLGMTTLSWTFAKNHFHYSLGLYGFFDPPTFEMFRESKLPIAPYANVYWIFNNGKTLQK